MSTFLLKQKKYDIIILGDNMNKDFITVIDDEGKEEQVELILTANIDKKKYLLYKNNQGEVLASYMFNDDDTLHNDLTEEEYEMLENLYAKGQDVYDKENK